MLDKYYEDQAAPLVSLDGVVSQHLMAVPLAPLTGKRDTRIVAAPDTPDKRITAVCVAAYTGLDSIGTYMEAGNG